MDYKMLECIIWSDFLLRLLVKMVMCFERNWLSDINVDMASLIVLIFFEVIFYVKFVV